MSSEHLANIKELEEIIMERVRHLNSAMWENEIEPDTKLLTAIIKVYDSFIHRDI